MFSFHDVPRVEYEWADKKAQGRSSGEGGVPIDGERKDVPDQASANNDSTVAVGRTWVFVYHGMAYTLWVGVLNSCLP